MTGTVAEVGSGLNGSRTKLKRLLADRQVGTIVVEHRERLACFGVEYVEAALAAEGRRLVVVEERRSTTTWFATSPGAHFDVRATVRSSLGAAAGGALHAAGEAA